MLITIVYTSSYTNKIINLFFVVYNNLTINLTTLLTNCLNRKKKDKVLLKKSLIVVKPLLNYCRFIYVYKGGTLNIV